MKKWNKRLTLLIILVLAMGILVGCSKELPDGIESKTFLKDMDEISYVSLISMSEKEYHEKEINSMLEKMSEKKYQDKLNEYEVILFELMQGIIPKIKEDLTTGNKVIQSTTLEEVETIRKLLGE